MANTRKQKRREQFAQLCESIGGKKSPEAMRLRESNRKAEKRKRSQFRGN